MTASSRSILDVVPVLPVVVIDRLADAVPLARALVAGGLPAIEVTLRTEVALDVVRAIATDVPEILVGVGTIVTPLQARQAADSGARFLVSPGSTPALIGAMAETGLPFLPGTATASEVLVAVEAGCAELKLFPAEASGGVALLTAFAPVFPDVRFCPTGGITANLTPAYLALPNVGCVGGSWIAPPEMMAARAWAEVTSLAAAAAVLR